MTPISEQEEFYVNLALFGGFALLALVFSIIIGMIVWKLLTLTRKKNIIKELYGKERKNGQKGSHGRF